MNKPFSPLTYPGAVLRTALRPRWLGLLVLTLALMALFWRLGLWQLHVAQDKGSGQSVVLANPTKPPVGIDTLLQPHEDFPGELSGRRVTMTGSYAADGQVLVAGRLLDGASGFWVLTPLYASGHGTAAQSPVLPFVRGFVTDASAAPAPPTGTVTVTGSLAPGESPSTSSAALPEGQLGSVDLSVLVNRWPGQLYNAFVFATAETGSGGQAVDLGEALRRIPPPNPTGAGGLAWRNAAYALQWWVFAIFAGWMWVKMVRDDHLMTQAARRAEDDLADNGADDEHPAQQKDPTP